MRRANQVAGRRKATCMKKPLIFEVLRSKKEFYFRLKAHNGRILAHSETYKRRATVLKLIDSFNNKPFEVKDLTK